MKKYTKSVLVLLALMALAIGLITALAWRLDQVTQEEIVAQFSQRQLLLAEQTAATVQHILDEVRRDLLHCARDPSLTMLTAAQQAGDEEKIALWQEILGKYWLSFIRSHPTYAQIRYIDPDGQEIVRVDSDGEVVRVVPTAELQSQAGRDFFVETMKLAPGEIYVLPLGPDLAHGQAETGPPIVHLSTPVFDEQGHRRGIVAINLFTDRLTESIARVGDQEGMDAWVLDKRGVEVINVTHPERVGNNTYEYCQQTNDENLILLMEDMLAGGSGTGIHLWPEQEGGPLTKKVLAYAPVHFDGEHWSVGISAPYSDVLAAHAKTRDILFYMLGGIVCAILASGILLIRIERRKALIEERARSADAVEQRNRELATLNTLTEKRNSQLALVNAVGRLATSILDLDEMLKEVTRAIQTSFNYYNVALFLLDKSRRQVVMRAVAGGFEELVPHTYRQSVDKGIIGWVARTGQSLLANDVSQEPRYVNSLGEVLTRSELCVPLKLDDEVIGALDVQSIHLNAFEQADIVAMEALAAQIAAAIRNARFYAEREGRIAELAALNQISQAISSTLHLDELAELIHREVSRILDVAAFHIALYDQETDMLDYLLMIDEGIREPRHSGPVGQGLSSLIVATKKPILIRNFEEEQDKYPPAIVWGTGKLPPSWMGIPLLVGDKVVGVMSVQSYRPHAYDEADLELLLTIGSQVAIAIENARLFAAEQTRRRQAEILRDVSRVMGSTLDLESVLHLILEQLKRVLTYDTASLLLFSAEGPAMIALTGYEDEETVIKEAALRLGDSPVLQEMTTAHQPIVIPDVRQDERWIWVPGAEHVRAWIGVPLLVRDEMIGALMVDSTQPGFYTQRDAELIQALANQAAVAIENARLFEAEARRRKEAETLRVAAQALTATLDLQQVFELILAQLRQVVPYDSASVQILKENCLEIIGGLGFPNLEELLGVSIPLDGDNPNRRVMATRAPFIVDDASALYEDFRQEPHAQARIRAWLGVPLLFGDHLIGMITLDKREAGFYTEEHARLALAFAAQAAIAIENARLYAELQARMREMQTILDHTPLSIALLDTEMRYMLVNKFAEEKEGYRLDEIKGRRCCEIWGRAKPCEGCPASLALGTGEIHRREGEILPGYIAEEICVPIKDEQGHIQGILNIRRDVTERQRLQTQLLQSGKLSAVGQLISGVAHELNNPLTSIMGYAELVQREASVDGAIKADLRKIYEQAERSAHIVRKLLTFARQYPPERERTDVNRAIEKTIELLAYQLDVDNITVVRDLDPTLPHTLADVHQLQQVFLNIINNAHQVMKQAHGRGTLTVRTRLVDEGQTIRITFSDDGPGIPPSIIARIFDPFFTTKDVGEGTGLGLAICYGIVTEHGGRIWAKSEPGQGATFFVELPVVRESDKEARLASSDKSPQARPAVPSRRILIIEDELIIAGLLARILKLEGHTTDLATDGNQALARLRRADYDAIICDLKMPGLNGQEFYQRLVEMDSPLVQRVIFTTGDVVNPETRAFLEQTDRPCISKPFLQEDVLAALREVFGEREA